MSSRTKHPGFNIVDDYHARIVYVYDGYHGVTLMLSLVRNLKNRSDLSCEYDLCVESEDGRKVLEKADVRRALAFLEPLAKSDAVVAESSISVRFMIDNTPYDHLVNVVVDEMDERHLVSVTLFTDLWFKRPFFSDTDPALKQSVRKKHLPLFNHVMKSVTKAFKDNNVPFDFEVEMNDEYSDNVISPEGIED